MNKNNKNSLNDLKQIIDNFRESKNMIETNRNNLTEELKSLPLFIKNNIYYISEFDKNKKDKKIEKFINKINLSKLSIDSLYEFQIIFSNLIVSNVNNIQDINQESLNFISPTGSGKTYSYLIPIAYNLVNNSDKQTIVLTPNKNLCEQIFNSIKVLLKSLSIQNDHKNKIVNLDKRFIDDSISLDELRVIISTPVNQLNHILTYSNYEFINKIDTFIVDEADQLFNSYTTLNAIISIRNILIINKLKFQFYSATIFLNPSILNLLSIENIYFIVNQDKHLSSVKDDIINVPQNIENYQINESSSDSLNKLLADLLLKQQRKILIFFNSKNETFDYQNKFQEYSSANSLAKEEQIFLLNNKLNKMIIREEVKELRVANDFICFTSDLLSRGMDLESVDVVVNFNLNNEVSQFIHRMGRTGRKDNRGLVITMGTEAIHFISKQLDDFKLWQPETEVYN